MSVMQSLRPVLVIRPVLRPFFEVFVLVLAKAVLVLTLAGLKDLKNCGLKTKTVLRPQFLDQKDLKKAGNNQVFFGYRHDWAKPA